jgi:hypothetical protein
MSKGAEGGDAKVGGTNEAARSAQTRAHRIHNQVKQTIPQIKDKQPMPASIPAALHPPSALSSQNEAANDPPPIR